MTVTYECRKEIQVKKYLKHIFEGNEDELLNQLNDLLFLQVENWICSKGFYSRNISHREDYVRELVGNTISVWDENAPLNFNIFRN